MEQYKQCQQSYQRQTLYTTEVVQRNGPTRRKSWFHHLLCPCICSSLLPSCVPLPSATGDTDSSWPRASSPLSSANTENKKCEEKNISIHIENNVCYIMWQLYTNLRIQCDNYSQNQPRKNPMWQVHTKSTLVSFVTFIQEKGHFSITCLNYTENKLL